MKIRLEEIRPMRNGLKINTEIAHQQGWWMKSLWVPWSWMAGDEIAQAIQKERDKQHRPWPDAARPWLPLEAWE